jgi:hypothetical protein
MIKLCPVILLLFALVTPSDASATDYCNGITVTHSPPVDWTTLLATISQKYPPIGKYAFQNAIQLGEWRIVRVDDLGHGDDPPFFFFRGPPHHARLVWVYSGVGPGADDAAQTELPDIPTKLALCFQWATGENL